ncbi:MAG: rhomboid family intramembrane serine protease [Armatimonadetes bacterium]|nr:rhomboid family intramembrane serine protease [Armatimonadota bacterium]
MIPLRDENPTSATPLVVYGLIVANVLIYLYNGPLRPGVHNPLAGFELVPYELTTGRDVGPATPITPWLTIFTSAFMHANWLHIAGNMLYLWIFGNNVEDTFGHFRFLLFYLLSGVGAALLQVLIAPFSTIPMVGASGAIAGVLGAYLILFPDARIITLTFFFFVQLVEYPASIVLGLWILIQIISLSGMDAAAGGVAYAAHVGGFITGVFITYLLGGRKLLRRRRQIGYWYYRRPYW